MRYVAIVSLVVALCVAGAWAGLNPETGAMDGPWKAQTGSPSPKNVNVPVSIPTISVDATRPEALGDVKALHYESLVQQLMERDGLAPSQPPHILWGTDVLIRSAYLYRISVDCFTNSPYNAYAAVQKTQTIGSDTVFNFRTTDQGYSWESWSQGPYVFTTFGFEKQKVLCMPGDTNWVVNLFLENPAGGRRWLYARFMDPQSGAFRWSIIDNAAADTIYDFDATLQNGVTNPIIYTTYTKSYNSTADSFVIWKVRSTDWGRTWVDRAYIWNYTYEVPRIKIAGGMGGWVYVTYADRYTHTDSIQCHIKRSTDYGVTFGADMTVSSYAYPMTDNFGVAAGPGDSTVWVLHGFRSPTYGLQLIRQYSLNNGATWFTHKAIRSSTNDEGLGSLVALRGGYGGGLNYPAIAFNVGPTSGSGDTTWSGTLYSGAPDTFYVDPVGDYSASTSAGPIAGRIVRSNVWQAWTAYAGFGPTDVWADYNGTANGVEVETPIARKVSGNFLAQNIPNPFGKTTKIAFSLPKSGSVDLAVYDIAGRKVATLAQGTMSAGSHEVSWNGAKAPAGVYLYRLSFEGKTLTNRMVVVR